MDENSSPQPYDPGPDASPPPVDPAPEVFTEGKAEPKPDQPISQPRRDNWIWGMILVFLGGMFLLQNFSTFHLVNWWAVFILIPAAGSFATAWRSYQASGHLTSSTRSTLFGGVIFTVVALIFLLNLDLGRWWPVFLVAAGLAVVLNALFPD